MFNTGVYRWVNLVDGKMYIGGAYKCLAVRKMQHIYQLRSGTHFNKHFQRAYIKYGEIAFEFQIIEKCDPQFVKDREQYWIDKEISNGHLYNIQPTAGSPLGIKRSEEFRRKCKDIANRKDVKNACSEARKKWWRVPENRVLFKGRKGRPHSDEIRRKISDSKKGKTNGHKGMKRSKELREKIRQHRIAYWKRIKAEQRDIIFADPIIPEAKRFEL
jgi:group I intron endonuclease